MNPFTAYRNRRRLRELEKRIARLKELKRARRQ